MVKIILAIILCLISTVTFAAPTNAKGNNLVYDWEMDWPVDCDGDTVTDLLANLTGWSKLRSSRVIAIEIYRSKFFT